MLAEVVQLAGESTDVEVNLTLNGIIALLIGILILIRPKLLNYLVAAYLIIIGLIEILGINI